MKKPCALFLAAVVMFVALSLTAMAQETNNWTGLYGGFNVDYDKGKIETTVSGSSFGKNTKKWDASGALFGVQLGYNHQFDRFVFGLETDLQTGNIKGGWGSTSVTDTLGRETKLNWFGTTRIRLGYSLGRFMPYITGGVAYGQPVTTTTSDSLSANIEETNGAVGYTLGGGIEYMISRNLLVRGEYLYTNLGISSLESVISGGDFKMSQKLKSDVFRICVNYRF